MRIAYLALVHRNPKLLARAIGALSSPSSAFFIHVDKKSDLRDFSEIAGDNILLIEPRIPAFWGEYSLVRATMRLIEQALSSPSRFDYFVLLLGSDYPLMSGRYVEEFLEKHNGSEFISLVKMPAPGYPLSKINKLRYPSDKPARRFASRVLAKVGLANKDYRRHLGNLKAFAGDQSWALTRGACEYILDFVKRNPSVERYFQNTFTSDEMFFHTIIGNSPLYPQTRRSLLYRDWPKPASHPLDITTEHVKWFESREVILINDEWGSGEVLFARKFSDEHLDVIDQIDQMIALKQLRS